MELRVPGERWEMRIQVHEKACVVQTAGKLSGMRNNSAAGRIVTSDLDRFWSAFDAGGDLAENLTVHYLDDGSVGLHEFAHSRLGGAVELASVIEQHRPYYASIRRTLSDTGSQLGEVSKVFFRFADLLPGLPVPDVYMLVGKLDSGGTVSSSGLLIGSEMFCLSGDAVTGSLEDWRLAALRPVEALPVIVAHELAHFQQLQFLGADAADFDIPSLLALAVIEGAAELMAELLTGTMVNSHLLEFALPKEAELWEMFRADMMNRDFSGWFYQGAPQAGVPADLGYFMGYRIVRSYYDSAIDKGQALLEILQVRDFDAFLLASNYYA